MRVGPPDGAIRPSWPAKGPSTELPSVSMAKPSSDGAIATRTLSSPVAGRAKTSAALGPASVRLASTVKGPKSVCVPSPASWVVPSRTLPSSAICTLLASIRRRLKSSGALPPTATPPRTRMGVPARLASVALVTGAMRASRSAESRHGDCGARASWMTAVPFNVPTLSRASRSARIGPRIWYRPADRSPRRARLAEVPGNARRRSSDRRVDPLSTSVPRPVPFTRRGSSMALPLVTRETASPRGSVHRVPSYRAVPCCRRPANFVPLMSTSPTVRSWRIARSEKAPSTVASIRPLRRAIPSPSRAGSRTEAASSIFSALLSARSSRPLASSINPRPAIITRPSKRRWSIAMSALSATSSPSARAGMPLRKSDGSNFPRRPKRPDALVMRIAAMRASSLRTSRLPDHCDHVPSPRMRAV